MKRPWLYRLCKQPWLWLALLVLLGGGLLGYPQLAAWHHYTAGRNALEAYHTAAARAHLRSCLDVWPDDIQANLWAARAARRAGDLADAELHLDECRKRAGGRLAADVALEWALLQAARGDFNLIEETLQSRLENDSAQAPLILEALAEGYRRMCRVHEARDCLDSWLRRQPDNVQALFLRGGVHRQVGAVSRARDDYLRVVQIDPGHDDARRLLVRCLVQLGRFQDCLEHLEVLRRHNADDLELQVYEARCRHDLGQAEEARQILEQVLAADGGNGPALRERARGALGSGRAAEAEGWFRKAAAVLPIDYEVHWGLYRSLQQQGRESEAERQLARTLQLKDRLERLKEIEMRQMPSRPFDPALHCEIGTIYLELGEKDTAQRWLLSAVRLGPDRLETHAALARYYREQGDSGKAAAHEQRAQRPAKKL